MPQSPDHTFQNFLVPVGVLHNKLEQHIDRAIAACICESARARGVVGRCRDMRLQRPDQTVRNWWWSARGERVLPGILNPKQWNDTGHQVLPSCSHVCLLGREGFINKWKGSQQPKRNQDQGRRVDAAERNGPATPRIGQPRPGHQEDDNLRDGFA